MICGTCANEDKENRTLYLLSEDHHTTKIFVQCPYCLDDFDIWKDTLPVICIELVSEMISNEIRGYITELRQGRIAENPAWRKSINYGYPTSQSHNFEGPSWQRQKHMGERTGRQRWWRRKKS